MHKLHFSTKFDHNWYSWFWVVRSFIIASYIFDEDLVSNVFYLGPPRYSWNISISKIWSNSFPPVWIVHFIVCYRCRLQLENPVVQRGALFLCYKHFWGIEVGKKYLDYWLKFLTMKSKSIQSICRVLRRCQKNRWNNKQLFSNRGRQIVYVSKTSSCFFTPSIL